MKSALLVIFVAGAISATAQVGKCKCTQNLIDSFTGNRIVQTKAYQIGKTERGDRPFFVTVRRVNDKYFLQFTSPTHDCASKDTEVSFKTVAGQVATSTHFGDYDCGRTSVLEGYSYKSKPVVKISADDELIRKSGLAMIRISNKESFANVNLTMPMNLKVVFDCVDAMYATPVK